MVTDAINCSFFLRRPTKLPIMKAYRKIQAYRELGCLRRPFATTLDESSTPRVLPPRLTAQNRCTPRFGQNN